MYRIRHRFNKPKPSIEEEIEESIEVETTEPLELTAEEEENWYEWQFPEYIEDDSWE
jgi:hypothetical protein